MQLKYWISGCKNINYIGVIRNKTVTFENSQLSVKTNFRKL